MRDRFPRTAAAVAISLACAWPAPAPRAQEPAAKPAGEPAAAVAAQPAAEGPVLFVHAQAGIPPTPDQRLAERSLARALENPLRLTGYFWVDTGYMARTNRVPGTYDQDASYMQGRLVLAATYRRQVGEWFAGATVELLGLVNEYTNARYEPHVQDAYLTVGGRRWDVQIGRLLAWEVYYRGQGIELYSAEEAGAALGPTLYLLDFTRGYANGPGQAALHLYPLDRLGIEVAAVYGQESEQNHLGIRPVANVRLWGGLELVGGWEYLRQSAQKQDVDKVEVTSQGWAARLQYALPARTVGSGAAARRLPLAVVGADVSQAKVDRTTIEGLPDTGASFDKTSAGGFLDVSFWRNTVGVGYHHTIQENDQGEENTHDQAFVSWLYHLPFKGLTVKAVYGFATAHVEDSDANDAWDDDLSSFRVRIGYDFF